LPSGFSDLVKAGTRRKINNNAKLIIATYYLMSGRYDTKVIKSIG
jgi:hypothetical protein